MRLIVYAAIAFFVVSCNEQNNFSSHPLTEVENLIAENGALRFANQFDQTHVSCFTIDSNGDRFITCTNRDKRTGEPIQLSCGYEKGRKGCRKKVDGPMPRVEEGALD